MNVWYMCSGRIGLGSRVYGFASSPLHSCMLQEATTALKVYHVFLLGDVLPPPIVIVGKFIGDHMLMMGSVHTF